MLSPKSATKSHRQLQKYRNTKSSINIHKNVQKSSSWQQSRVFVLVLKKIADRKVRKVFKILKLITVKRYQSLNFINMLYLRKMKANIYQINRYAQSKYTFQMDKYFQKVNLQKILFKKLCKIYFHKLKQSFQILKKNNFAKRLQEKYLKALLSNSPYFQTVKYKKIAFHQIKNRIQFVQKTKKMLTTFQTMVFDKLMLNKKLAFVAINLISQKNHCRQIFQQSKEQIRTLKKKKSMKDIQFSGFKNQLLNLQKEIEFIEYENSQKNGLIKREKLANKNKTIIDIRQLEKQLKESTSTNKKLSQYHKEISQIIQSRHITIANSRKEKGAIYRVTQLYLKLKEEQNSKGLNSQYYLNKQKFRSICVNSLKQLDSFAILNNLKYQNRIVNYQKISSECITVSQQYTTCLQQNKQLKNIINTFLKYLILNQTKDRINSNAGELQKLFEDLFAHMRDEDQFSQIPSIKTSRTMEQNMHKRQTARTSEYSLFSYK